jgi:hypothetical protein
MKYIKLTQNKRTIVDDEDFEYLNQWKWQFSKGYAVRMQYDSATQKQHPVFIHKELIKTNKQVDHINRNRLDNQKSNLRECTAADNSHNRSKQYNNTSGFIGVTRAATGLPWKAFIYLDNHRIHITTGENPEDLGYIRDQVALQLFGEFANTNLEII